MTDRDDRQTGDGLHRSNSASERAQKNEQRETSKSHAGRGKAATHHDPTDPEVPNAKRRGARRRQSSFVALATLITGLLAIALWLLYRASGKFGETLTSGRLAATIASLSDPDLSLSNPANHRPTSEQGSDIEPSKEKVVDVLVAEDEPEGGSLAPDASSVRSKGDPPASDIIRTPTF